MAANKTSAFHYRLIAGSNRLSKYGFIWSGDWHSRKDYQYFEYLG